MDDRAGVERVLSLELPAGSLRLERPVHPQVVEVPYQDELEGTSFWI